MGPQPVISNHTPPHGIKDLPQTFIGWLFNFNLQYMKGVNPWVVTKYEVKYYFGFLDDLGWHYDPSCQYFHVKIPHFNQYIQCRQKVLNQVTCHLEVFLYFHHQSFMKKNAIHKNEYHTHGASSSKFVY